jgi:hypothetical protein
LFRFRGYKWFRLRGYNRNGNHSDINFKNQSSKIMRQMKSLFVRCNHCCRCNKIIVIAT